MAKRKMTIITKGCVCKCSEFEEPTRPDLAVTPAQVKDLTDRGIPVSTPNASQFIDTDTSGSWDIEPMFQRDADTNKLWEQQQLARNKVVKAHRKDKKTYG